MAKKYIVDLERDEQEMLTGLIASGTQRVRKINHARILLKAGDGWTDQKISEALDVSVPTIERVRQHFVEEGIQRALSLSQNPAEISAPDGWRSRSALAGAGMQSTSQRASALESPFVGQRDDPV